MLIKFLTLLFMVNDVISLTCYQCSSLDNVRCFQNDLLTSKECSLPNSMVQCGVIHATIENVQVTTRDCIPFLGDCITFAKYIQYEDNQIVNNCNFCQEDNCNSSVKVLFNKTYLILTLLTMLFFAL